MEGPSVLDKIVFSFFLDSKARCALSATYPVSTKLKCNNVDQPGSWGLETLLNYPCFQVYISTDHSFLDTPEGHYQAKQVVVQIISDLERIKFFQAVDGIRFELYDGRLEFALYPVPGKANRKCIEAIGKHAIEEREQRNTLTCFKKAVDKYNESRPPQHKLQEWKASGILQSDLQQIVAHSQQDIDCVCEVAAVVSSEVADFNTWRRRCDDETSPQRQKKRRHTMASPECRPPISLHLRRRRSRSCPLSRLTLSSTETQSKPAIASRTFVDDPNSTDFSPGEHRNCNIKLKSHQIKAMPNRQQYMRRRIERLIGTLLTRYCVPIIPTSFYSPPNQPWHMVVIVLQGLDLKENGMYMMRFGKGTSLRETYTDSFSTARHFDCRLQPVSLGPSNGSTEQQAPNLGVILGWHLYLLGLTNPSFQGTPLDAVTGIKADGSAWFGPADHSSQSLSVRYQRILREELGQLGHGISYGRDMEAMAINEGNADDLKDEALWSDANIACYKACVPKSGYLK